MDKKKIIELTEKYTNGNCTEEEMILLENWYLNWLPEKISINETELDRARSEVFSRLPVHQESKTRSSVGGRYYWRRFAAAAAVILVVGGGLFYYKYTKDPLRDIRQLEVAGRLIRPGSSKAYLTLADGKRISLTDEQNGVLSREAGIEISKTEEGKLVYKIGNGHAPGKSGHESLNKIETPNGGQYQVYLPDGTRIWLNAASSIIYAANFTSAGERSVELKGEAYFEVAKDKKHPFVVKCPGQEVRVLGTHFNINCYKEEHQVKTTLTEGSVKVSIPARGEGEEKVRGTHDVMLIPGQQSVFAAGKIQVVPADIEADLAWKEGLFVFRDEPLENIMHQIARWYDVEVVFEGDIASRHFEGTISRFKNISEVLRKFQLTKNVHFKIEGRRVTVMP